MGDRGKLRLGLVQHAPRATLAENRDRTAAGIAEVALARLQEIASQAGKTPVQLALQWLAAQSVIDGIIIGATRPSQLQENIAAAEGMLDKATLDACDGVWADLRGDSFQYNR